MYTSRIYEISATDFDGEDYLKIEDLNFLCV